MPTPFYYTGGNSRTTMLATISPIHLSYGESLSTLKYLERVKLVVNNVGVNMRSASESIELQKLLSQIVMLKETNAMLVTQIKSQEEEYSAKLHSHQAVVEAEFKGKIANLTKRISTLEDEVLAAYEAYEEGTENEKLNSVSSDFNELPVDGEHATVLETSKDSKVGMRVLVLNYSLIVAYKNKYQDDGDLVLSTGMNEILQDFKSKLHESSSRYKTMFERYK